mmetsp:Transcript_39046/g.82122  ORF Transcript_39046/g.82122 Transcript_39046/m.82122 type:complete len:105 (-) Transcript_39046:78-392(-)|eukprot:CAMPEP_0183733836 /NCGR_PEP_ID=MMETSP0737-20130205/42141_1 /TAXON_ID=385413 /ORGANISM="Thalassiosira miniscula, Strain CCMP1093" /LENGTH=104 /DNA_ID=CAMNT_0025967175 /DNA_START=253 /DNA_END=567 /DNA_ORIENTATION=+
MDRLKAGESRRRPYRALFIEGNRVSRMMRRHNETPQSSMKMETNGDWGENAAELRQRKQRKKRENQLSQRPNEDALCASARHSTAAQSMAKSSGDGINFSSGVE